MLWHADWLIRRALHKLPNNKLVGRRRQQPVRDSTEQAVLEATVDRQAVGSER